MPRNLNLMLSIKATASFARHPAAEERMFYSFVRPFFFFFFFFFKLVDVTDRCFMLNMKKIFAGLV